MFVNPLCTSRLTHLILQDSQQAAQNEGHPCHLAYDMDPQKQVPILALQTKQAIFRVVF